VHCHRNSGIDLSPELIAFHTRSTSKVYGDDYAVEED